MVNGAVSISKATILNPIAPSTSVTNPVAESFSQIVTIYSKNFLWTVDTTSQISKSAYLLKNVLALYSDIGCNPLYDLLHTTPLSVSNPYTKLLHSETPSANCPPKSPCNLFPVPKYSSLAITCTCPLES